YVGPQNRKARTAACAVNVHLEIFRPRRDTPGMVHVLIMTNSSLAAILAAVIFSSSPQSRTRPAYLKEAPDETDCFRALVAVAALAGAVASVAPGSGQADEEAAPIFGVKIPPGYRDWRLISVAHEAGNLNDLRAILGNDVAIKASREGKLPFPDGTIIARLAWSYDPLQEGEKAFGRRQSFVAGPPKNGVQFMVKDSK